MESKLNSPSLRQISKLIKKFSINNGDILALKHNSANANKETIDVIIEAVTKMGLNILVIVVEDFDDLSVLNETAMNTRGWFKLDKLRKLIRPKERETDD
jgi:hypothetical protein